MTNKTSASCIDHDWVMVDRIWTCALCGKQAPGWIGPGPVHEMVCDIKTGALDKYVCHNENGTVTDFLEGLERDEDGYLLRP